MRRKNLLVIAGVLFAGMLYAGCGSSEKTISGTPELTEGSQSADSAAVVESDGKEEQAAATEETGYVFVSDGFSISVDMDMEEVLEALGEPKSYFEAESCAFHGLDKVYTYAGFEIDTYPQDDKDYISDIILKDDTVSTKEGISLSMVKDDVVAAYGEGYTEEDGMIVYDKDGMKLCFIFSDDYLTAVEYRSSILYSQD
jgi:hypothetical protein